MSAISAPGPGIDLAAGLRELGIVHRREQAALLRAAARLACANLPRGRLFVAFPRVTPRDGLPGEDRPSWREACREEVALAEADEVEVHPLLRSLSRISVRAWPNASRLALAAQELDRCHVSALDLARARVAEGNLEAGTGILRDLLEAGLNADDRGDALEALGLACESMGQVAGSLAWYEAAIGLQKNAVRVAVSMLALALRHGDAARAEIASERLRPLALSVPGTRARFEEALGRARSRAVADRTARPSSRTRAGDSAILRLAQERSGAAALVARMLLLN